MSITNHLAKNMGACLPSAVSVSLEPVSLEPVSLEPVSLEPVSLEPVSLEQRLQEIDPTTVPKVPLQNRITLARIEEIYDGDTVKIIVLLSDTPVRFSLRILGIDTPEIKHSEGRLPQEHAAAVKVRDYIRSLFANTNLIAKVRIHEWDKYGGRVLGDLFLPTGESVSHILVSGGWARPYNGEKKKGWTLDDFSKPPFG